jgi:transcription initiation factor TFIID subunit 1
LLVNTSEWEKNIIIDPTGSAPTSTSLSTLSNELINERIKYAGWVPSSEHRTLASYQSKVFGKKVEHLISLQKDQAVPATTSNNSTSLASSSRQSQQQNNQLTSSTNWNSIFSNDNYELLYGEWEKRIIIDPQKEIDPVSLLKPAEFYLDPNDDNLLFGLIDDETPMAFLADELNKVKEAGDNTEGSKLKDKSKLAEKGKLNKQQPIAGKASSSGGNENDECELTDQQQKQGAANKNIWNISNDEYYNAKAVTETANVNATATSKNISAALVLQHTQEALELSVIFFPTHISAQKLRNFHRYPLKKQSSGMLSVDGKLNPISSSLKRYLPFSSINSKSSHAKHSQSLFKSADFQSSSCIRSVKELSCTDTCETILVEYSEQYPPLMAQTGMASKIRNYYKRKFGKDDGPVNKIEYGELVYVNQSPFLGSLKPGECLQVLENFMFRAPLYQHKIPEHDFILVRTRHSGYILKGDIKRIFVVGQQCPLIEVPGPNSKRANSFIKDFLQVHIFRLFQQSRQTPKRIKMEDIKQAFPTFPESTIRKRLKLCADFRRTGKMDTNWWILKEDVRLPSEEELRAMITPEQCCAYYSMLAAEQRLKDAGYGEKNLFASEDDDVDNIKIDDEVKNAPWHTTRAYLDAVKGKCLLQVNGVADPTGRGEGFSYVRQPFKPNKQEEEGANASVTDNVSSPQVPASQTAQPPAAKKTVTGTDADLRRLHLSEAKELLANYGVPEHEIKKLKRWEIIDVVRTLSTQKAKEGTNDAVSKFARGNRYSQSDAHEKFREECQRLFELQNRNLASEEPLSTDDDELDEDSDVDEMGKDLESMLQSKAQANTSTNGTGPNLVAKSTTKAIITTSNDKADDSSELKSLIMGEQQLDAKLSSVLKETLPPPGSTNMVRVLKLTRTYQDERTGEEYTKVELIKKPHIIDAYLKIRTSKDDEFIRSAFALDETEKEKLRKERRRLQEQLRRVKRNEAKRATAGSENTAGAAGDTVKKVRKYTKRLKVPKSSKFVEEAGGGGEQATMDSIGDNTQQSLLSSPERATVKTKKLGKKTAALAVQQNFSSNDDEDKSLMNQTTIIGSALATANDQNKAPDGSKPAKRKYQKRKRPDAAGEGPRTTTIDNSLINISSETSSGFR